MIVLPLYDFLSVVGIMLASLMCLVMVGKINSNKTLLAVCLYVYLGLLFVLVWSDVKINLHSVTIGFKFNNASIKYVDYSMNNLKFIDVVINCFMLIPVGFVYPDLTHNTNIFEVFGKTLLLGLSISILIELNQYILPIDRAVQLSDVYFNVVSVIIGETANLGLNLVLCKSTVKTIEKNNRVW